jgi:tetratricopeptide (TPR) repeat protein
MMPVRIQSERGVDKALAKALVSDARRRARGGEADPAVQAQLAEVEYDAGNDAEAEAAADRSLAADPAQRDAMLYKARVLMRRAAAKDDNKLWGEAREWIVRANRLDPNASEPLLMYYDSYLEQGQQPSKSAASGLARAFELAPQDRGLRFRHARQLLIEGNAKTARRVLLPIAYDPHARGASNQALAMVELIDAGKLPEALAKAGAAKDKDEPGE